MDARVASLCADTSTLENEIDHSVYALYGLTPEEIALVEEGEMLESTVPEKIKCGKEFVSSPDKARHDGSY